jgi:DNA invertase Pin-like site-specific DNA recombinase
MFGIYVRVSEVGEREGDRFGSPEEQEAAARAWAEREGVEVDDPTIELDVSGGTAVADRKLGRLIERCESGALEGVIVRYEDRFARDVIEGAIALKRIEDSGTRLIATASGFDSKHLTPDKRAWFNIQMAFAQAQREKNRLARMRGAQRAAERGLHLAAHCPTGYRWVDRQRGGRRQSEGGGVGRIEPDPKMAPRVVEAFRRRANGESFEKLARFLGLAGKSSARAVISNRVYLGEATVPTERTGETRTITNAHPPLVTEEEWERAQAAGGSWVPRSGRWSALVRLGGLVRCSGCGKPLAVGSLRGREPYYSCTAEGCKQRVGIRAALLDEWVGGVVTDAVYRNDPHVTAILAGDDRYGRALAAVENARLELDAYRAEIKVSDVGAEAWKRDVAARKVALNLARAELRSIPAAKDAYAGKLPVTAKQWTDASQEERVRIIEAAMDKDRLARVVDRVIVKPVGRGRRVPVEQRVEVWFIGSEKPAVAA